MERPPTSRQRVELWKKDEKVLANEKARKNLGRFGESLGEVKLVINGQTLYKCKDAKEWQRVWLE